MCSLECEGISSYGKEETLFFLKTAHCYGLIFFFDKHLFIRPENSKASLKIESQTFLRQKLSTFVVSK